VVGEGDPAVADVPDHVLRVGLRPGVSSAARAPPPGGLGAGQQQVQGGEVRQDAVLADVGILRPGRIGRGGAGVTVTATECPASRWAKIHAATCAVPGSGRVCVPGAAAPD